MMTDEEVRIRATYLLLSCSRMIERLKARLLATTSKGIESSYSRNRLEKTLDCELGLLFRYWATRRIWNHLTSQEADAKRLNLALLRLFVEHFKIPQDGSGLRYAELSTAAEEVEELNHRLAIALGRAHQPMVDELRISMFSSREAVVACVKHALTQPLERLESSVATWTRS